MPKNLLELVGRRTNQFSFFIALKALDVRFDVIPNNYSTDQGRSPPQRLLLVNTSESKKREAGALETENGSAGNDGKREKAGAFPSVPHAL